MTARYVTRLEPLETDVPGLDLRARFDVLLHGSWAGVLHLTPSGHWHFLTGPYRRDERDRLERRPGRVDFLGCVLGPDLLGNLAEAHLYWASASGERPVAGVAA